MKKFLMFLLFDLAMGAIIALVFGFTPEAGALCGVAAGLLMPAIGGGCLNATVFREIWTGEMIKALRSSPESVGWLDKLLNKSQYADNDAIHFADIGVDPDVLINNTTYPIEVQELSDGDKVVKLNKYQTTATPITDDELHASSYDRMASVIERHRDVVNETKIAHALHALAPATHATDTPVIMTTGADSTADSRKKLTREDILSMKKAFDRASVPTMGRVLVLCPDHVNDLLENDQKFANQYYNYTSGKIANLYGFEVYEYVNCPFYNTANSTKVAYGAAVSEGDKQASVAFFAPNCIRVEGSTTTYLSDAKTDPTTQRNLFNIRHYFVALPLRNRAMGAIVSAKMSA